MRRFSSSRCRRRCSRDSWASSSCCAATSARNSSKEASPLSLNSSCARDGSSEPAADSAAGHCPRSAPSASAPTAMAARSGVLVRCSRRRSLRSSSTSACCSTTSCFRASRRSAASFCSRSTICAERCVCSVSWPSCKLVVSAATSSFKALMLAPVSSRLPEASPSLECDWLSWLPWLPVRETLRHGTGPRPTPWLVVGLAGLQEASAPSSESAACSRSLSDSWPALDLRDDSRSSSLALALAVRDLADPLGEELATGASAPSGPSLAPLAGEEEADLSPPSASSALLKSSLYASSSE
mmetsp:Transcript_39511/g.126668  ORF Transcript_39511/g.126668 Transcript_39511/m.126668 type:complete len:298 (-) Transcript_39511:572-1465(-)